MVPPKFDGDLEDSVRYFWIGRDGDAIGRNATGEPNREDAKVVRDPANVFIMALTRLSRSTLAPIMKKLSFNLVQGLRRAVPQSIFDLVETPPSQHRACIGYIPK